MIVDTINTELEKFIGDRKDSKLSLFKNDYDEMISAYNRELSTTKGYNGRQLLELLQNCDDQSSDQVFIELNEEKNLLSIANLGVPFSLEGYRSLFTSDLSSKVDKTLYIGNKGLGFRSILNWADEVNIYSNSLKVTYSDQIRNSAFNELFDEREKTEIREQFKIPNKICPIPVLTVPEVVNDSSHSQFSAVITIKYKDEFLDDILQQIRSINAETILFLKHITEISFKGISEKEGIKILRNKHSCLTGSFQKITSKSEIWDLYEKTDVLPEEYQDQDGVEENYQVKIAVPRGKAEHKYKLFSFFPTNISLDFPYIIHATFDLDQNRKQLEYSDKNKYVVRQLVDLMKTVALIKAETKVDWQPYFLLRYKGENENLEELDFYEELDNVLNKEKIIPCTNNLYSALEEAVCVDKEFAILIHEGGGGEFFQDHIQPLPETIESLKTHYVDYDDFIEMVNQWSNQIRDIKLRAKLIKYLVNRNILNNLNDQYNVLIDLEGGIISSGNDVFTYVSKELRIPPFSSISILNIKLFDELIEVFEITEKTKQDRSRALQNKVKSISKLYDYDFLPLSRKLIDNAREAIKNNKQEEKEIIQQMLSSLYYNYSISSITTQSINLSEVPLLDNTGKVGWASEMFFSTGYDQGILSEQIFGDWYITQTHIASPKDLGFNDVENSKLTDLLSWLGVNSFVKYETKTINNSHDPYVIEVLGYSPTSASVQVIYFNDRERLFKNLSIEQFILWLSQDKRLKKNLNLREKLHGERINFFYRTTDWKTADESYLSKLVQKEYYNFKDHLIESNYKHVNEKIIDYSHPLFKDHSLKRREIDRLIHLVGGASDFNDLSIDRVGQIINKVHELYPNGRNSASYYRRAYLHYEENEEDFQSTVKLFAKDNEGLKLFEPQKIYFSDKVKLPNKLREDFPIFNYPRRSGGKKAIDFFGINDLSQIDIDLGDYVPNFEITRHLTDYITELMPYVFIHRINALDNETSKRNEAAALKKLKITICNSLSAKINSKFYELDQFEFIYLKDDGYYMKISGEDLFSKIKRDSQFKDSLSEILSHLFDVSSHKSEFRAIFSTDLEDVKHLTKVNFTDDLLDETLEVLGYSSSRTYFWSTIFRILGLEYELKEENEVSLEDITKDLKADIISDLPDYDAINSRKNIDFLEKLFSQLGINIEDFNSFALVPINLVEYHHNRLTSYFLNNYGLFRKSLHKWCEQSVKKEQFLQKLHDFEILKDDFIADISSRYRYRFTLKNEVVFKIFIRKHFGKINLNPSLQIDIDAFFTKNKGILKDKELELATSNSKILSLLYFPIEIQTLRSRIKDLDKLQKEEHTNPSENKEPEKNGELGAGQIKRIKKYKTNKLSGYKNRKKLFSPNQDQDKKNAQKGKNSEKKVFDRLCLDYGKDFVHWKSKDDEGLHYDIRYSPDNGETYKFVEVKTFSGNSFIISREEVEFGRAKKDSYEIWLVKGDDLILFDQALKENDLSVKDYYVTFSEMDFIANI
ncbi:sacsin N-terminal ATP-binding-like domain-containing protein [Salinimicrobium sp. WS361]|uniref:sacsin N-terminal ATP-binding-like domain-containing protein n=1 Tax=Salinimicrobium sp. WS361 TaxID=3425123 RepID=UPI003D6ECB26